MMDRENIVSGHLYHRRCKFLSPPKWNSRPYRNQRRKQSKHRAGLREKYSIPDLARQCVESQKVIN